MNCGRDFLLKLPAGGQRLLRIKRFTNYRLFSLDSRELLTETSTRKNLRSSPIMQVVQPVHTFEGHSGRIFSLAICCMPDGRRWAASASHDRTVRIWCINTLQHLRTIEYSDFVWRVFIVRIPQPCVVAFVSAEGKIQISDLQTGELLNTFYGRLIFSGSVSIFSQPIIITAEGEEDVSFVDIVSGEKLMTIRGGFDKMFRAVVTHGNNPMLVFTTWNTQTRRSTIQTYDLFDHSERSSPLTVEDGQVPPSVPGSPGGKSDCSCVTSVSSKDRMALLFEGDSRDGVTSLVITQGGGTPRICSGTTGKPNSPHLIGLIFVAHCVGWELLGHYDFMVRLWSIETKELLVVLEGEIRLQSYDQSLRSCN